MLLLRIPVSFPLLFARFSYHSVVMLTNLSFLIGSGGWGVGFSAPGDSSFNAGYGDSSADAGGGGGGGGGRGACRMYVLLSFLLKSASRHSSGLVAKYPSTAATRKVTSLEIVLTNPRRLLVATARRKTTSSPTALSRFVV